MNESSGAKCIGIILDGNRRYAKGLGRTSLEGHTAGLARTKEIVLHAFSRGVDTIMLYAFSTENWNRVPEEIEYLMELFRTAIAREFDEFVQEGVRIRFVGDLARLPESLQTAAHELEAKSLNRSSGKTLVVALSYGGRAEIVAAVNKLLTEGKRDIDETAFNSALWTAGLPDPDLIIRTGGAKRLSNFLPWQAVYSELFFTDTYLPDFTTDELDAILGEFAERERRHGK